MSDYRAIATVTLALFGMINKAAQEIRSAESPTSDEKELFKTIKTTDIGDILISVKHPNQLAAQGLNSDQLGINIFLYQLESDPALQNADLPTRDRNGHVRQLPQAALKLNYLLTFYGGRNLLNMQLLLGKVVSALQAFPVIVPNELQKADVDFLDGEHHFIDQLQDLNLDQPAHVRLTPLSLSLDDLSKLWSVFFQTAYQTSLAYQASVVLIDAAIPKPPPAPPVLTRQIGFDLMSTPDPIIDSISPPTVGTGGTLTLSGQHFGRAEPPQLQVVIDNQVIETGVSLVNSRQITVTLPDDLNLGTRLIQVRVPQALDRELVGDLPPSSVTSELYSNIVSFKLAPVITGTPTNNATTLTLTTTTPVKKDQQVYLKYWAHEGDVEAAEQEPLGVSLVSLQSLSEDGKTLSFDAKTIPIGKYNIRLMVDNSPSNIEPLDRSSIAPVIAVTASTTDTLTLQVTPNVSAGQTIALNVDSSLTPEPISDTTDTLIFDVSAVSPNTYQIQLTVDDQRSEAISWTQPPA